MARLPNHLRLPATRRFQQALSTVTERATPVLHRAFDELDNIDEDSITALTAKVAPTMTAVKTSAVRSAIGYYSILSGVAGPAIAIGAIAVLPNLRAPFISVWQALASGNSYPDALAAGRSRVEAVVSDYAVSSARQTGDLFVARTGLTVHGWERIPDAGACPWCEEVAQQIYKSADSADFGHDRCGCTAAPAF